MFYLPGRRPGPFSFAHLLTFFEAAPTRGHRNTDELNRPVKFQKGLRERSARARAHPASVRATRSPYCNWTNPVAIKASRAGPWHCSARHPPPAKAMRRSSWACSLFHAVCIQHPPAPLISAARAREVRERGLSTYRRDQNWIVGLCGRTIQLWSLTLQEARGVRKKLHC
jgi:hypothetical protein